MPFDANDPDTKAALAAAVEEATDGLKAKVDDLIGVNQRLKTDLRSKSEINPADLEKAEADVDRLKADLATATKQAKDATAVAEKATKALEGEQIVTHRLIAENGLVAELTKAGVTDPDYLEMAKMAHIGKIKVVTEGEDRKAMYGDKPLADAIKEWAGTDAGKKVVAAPNNSGGGAPGGKGGESGKSIDQAGFDAMAPKARSEFFAGGGKIAA